MQQSIFNHSKFGKGLFLFAWFPLLFVGVHSQLAAITVTLSAEQTGNYLWARNQWSGGYTESDDFSYGDPSTGLITTKRLYYYFGGSDRYFEAADIYFQIPLADLVGMTIESATFHFYVATNNTSAETFLKHLETQSVVPTGDAAQQLAGTVNVASSTTMTVGWNSIDLSDFITSDLSQGYDYAVFSIPRFAQLQDENRLLQIYGASAADVDGASVKPYLEVVPESATGSLIFGSLALLWVQRRRIR